MQRTQSIPSYCIGQGGMNLSFIPYRVKNRPDIGELLERYDCSLANTQQWNEIMNGTYLKEIILQDLLLYAHTTEMDPHKRRCIEALAAELFIKLDSETGKDFRLNLHTTGVGGFVRDDFYTAMRANSLYHEEMERAHPGSTGLSKAQLALERKMSRIEYAHIEYERSKMNRRQYYDIACSKR